MSIFDTGATPAPSANTPAPDPSTGTPSPAKTDPAPNPAPAADPAPKEPEKKDFVVKRPENIPEKFWDAEKSEPKVDSILKSYTELEKKLSDQAAKAKAPEKYEYKVPEEVQKNFGLKELDVNHPMYKEAEEMAKSKGWSQETFTAMVDFYVTSELASAKAEQAAAIEKLGGPEKAPARIQTILAKAQSILTEPQMAVFKKLGTSAEVVEVLETMLGKVSAQRNLPDQNPQGNSGALTEEAVRAKMKDERYWHPQKRDPAFVAEVDRDFQRLYPD